MQDIAVGNLLARTRLIPGSYCQKRASTKESQGFLPSGFFGRQLIQFDQLGIIPRGEALKYRQLDTVGGLVPPNWTVG
jgi:hypothetical protein